LAIGADIGEGRLNGRLVAVLTLTLGSKTNARRCLMSEDSSKLSFPKRAARLAAGVRPSACHRLDVAVEEPKSFV